MCQVFACQSVRTMKKKLSGQNIVAFFFERWSFTRGSYHRAFRGKFWCLDRWSQIAYGRWPLREVLTIELLVRKLWCWIGGRLQEVLIIAL